MNFSVKSITFLITLFSVFTAYAQQGGTVSGKVIDAGNNEPVSFASVALISKADGKAAKGMQTDLEGGFKLTGVENGAYTLRITFVSYTSFTKDSINISAANNTVQLGTIKLRQAKGLLKEVVVKGQRSSTIQLGVDKKVFSVEQSLVSQGGSATDLLSNVPSVQVDVEGNVNLRGSSNVRVLINGKPSALTGGSVTDILQSIPASSIENIEVITNPSSKYEAEGQSGIINIVLKKNARIGFNGSASATAGTQNSYNGNLNLGYQTEKFNIFGNYSYRKGNRLGNGFTNRQTYLPAGDTLFQNQVSDQKFVFNSHNVRAGIDYNLTQKTTLSLSGNLNTRSRDRIQGGTTNIFRPLTMLTQRTIQDNNSEGKGTNIDANFDFDHKFKRQGETLTANVGYSTGDEDNYDFLRTDYNFYTPVSADLTRQNNYTKELEHNWNFQADYTLPFKDNKGRFEAGFRSTLNKNDNNYLIDTLNNSGVFIRDYTQTNHFFYNQYIHAVYANYQRQFGNFGIQGGLRLEDANIRTTLIDSLNNSLRNKQDYLRLYPSIFLSQKLTDAQTLQLSYTRRVSRPWDRQLTPFLDRSDPLNYQQGNPDLMPEDTHSFELSYINYWKTLTLTSSLYYRLTNDNFQMIREPIDATRTVTRFENVKSARNAGYELIGKINFTPNFDLTGNLNVYYRQIDGDAALKLQETSGYAWNGNLTGNIKPIDKLSLQLRYEYQAPQVIAQGKMKAMYGLDGGVKYDATKQLSLNLNARDIFNTRRFRSQTSVFADQFGYYQDSQRRFQTRVVSFTLSYRFGSTSQKQREKKKDNQDTSGGVPDEGGMQQIQKQ
jgi:outer membrane receptor protein involved in Fe transport